MKYKRVLIWVSLMGLLCFMSTAQSTTDLTNDRVIELTKMGMDDDVIVAKMKSGVCKFKLEDADLMSLKKAGVSSKVIASMLDVSAITAARVTIDKKFAELHTFGQAKVGGRLGNAFTYGIKSVKEKAYLQGAHAAIVTSPNPEIMLELPKAEAVENYILVELDGKGDRRELETGSIGGIVGSKSGIRAEAIRKMSITALGNNSFRVAVATPLKRGEYILYQVGSTDKLKEVYGRGFDFTVE